MPAIDYNAHLNTTLPPQQTASALQADSASSPSFGDEVSSLFHDAVEIVNPLQHIPVVSTLYRAITGDKIATAEKFFGDFLYGGPLGLASSIADSAFEATTGKDVGDTVLAFLTGDDDKQTAVASAQPATPAQVTPAQATPISGFPAMPDLSGLLETLQNKGADLLGAAGAYSKALSTLPALH